MSLSSISLILTIIIDLVLGGVVVAQGKKNRSTIAFFLITVGIFFWGLSLLIYEFILVNDIALLLSRIAYFSAAISVISLLNFSILFSTKEEMNPGKKYLILRILNPVLLLFFGLITFYDGLLLSGFTEFGVKRIVEFGPLYSLYSIILLVFFTVSFFLSFRGYKKEQDLLRKNQFKYVFLGILITVFGGLVTNLILPTFGNFDLYWIGPVLTLAMATSVSVSIIKYHLFNIKVVIAELLTFAIWTAVIAQAVMAETLNGKILGAVTFVFVIFIGIFLIKSVKKEVALREEVEQLAGRLKSVNRIMSHDIKNVLGKDKDMFGMLLDGSFGALSDQARPFLQQAHDDTKKLIRSVIVILESGHELVLKPEPFDFKEAVLEVVRDVESEATTKGLTLTTNISEEGDYMLVGDRVQLVTHVLKNLVENAVNYTLTGGVTVGLSKKEKSILFSVKDTGVGISDEDKPNMFKEGSHGKDSLKMNVHSTGYGLFSVKKIVDAHNGKVWFETAPGKGTTFFVELPRT